MDRQPRPFLRTTSPALCCSNADLRLPHRPRLGWGPSSLLGDLGRGGSNKMTAFNVVRVRVKPGQEDTFIEAHRQAKLDMRGFRRGVLIKTGEHTYCIIGEWKSMEALAAARPAMTSLLDQYRDALE